jgi:hypothetical protein
MTTRVVSFHLPPGGPFSPAVDRPGRTQAIAALFRSSAVVATALAAAPSRRHGRATYFVEKGKPLITLVE